jgi:hypothetical protein
MAKRYARVKLDIKKMEEENYGPAYECSMCHIHVRSFDARTICMECEEKQAAQPVVREQVK